MEDYDSKLSLDAGQYIAEVSKLLQINKNQIISMQSLISKMNEYNSATAKMNKMLGAAKGREAQLKSYAARLKQEVKTQKDLLVARRKSELQMRSALIATQNKTVAQQKMLQAYKNTIKASGRVSKAMKKAGEEGAMAANKALFSWRNMARLLAVQIAHQIVSKLTHAFRESVTEAIEYQKRIAEIRTISQDANLSFRQWADGIREVSNSFGFGVIDTANAAYQALSNQVTQGVQTFEFMADAAQFATVTNATLTDSVNLLSSVLNSYDMNAEKAGQTSATLFKIIELGRVRASEMANSFGTISKMSAQLGINLHELGAMITLLTNQGIVFSEAATFIRNILLKLIKPTENLQNLFEDWGVTSGEAAIETFTFATVLDKLDKATRGSTTEIGKLFGRVRAIQPALSLSGKGLEKYNIMLEEIKNSTEAYGVAIDETFKNAGKIIEIEINKIVNKVTKDFAEPFIASVASISTNIVGLSDIFIGFTKTVEYGIPTFILFRTTLTGSIIPAIGKMTASIGLLGRTTAATTGIFTANLSKMATKITSVTSITALAGLAIADILASSYRKQAKLHEERAKLTGIYSKRVVKQLEKRLIAEQKYYDESKRKMLRQIAEMNSALNQYEERNKEINKNLINSLKDRLDKEKRLLNNHTDAIKSIDNEIMKSKEVVIKNTKNVSEELFERELERYGEIGKISLLLKKMNKDIYEAEKAYQKENAEIARERMDEAISLNERIYGIRKNQLTQAKDDIKTLDDKIKQLRKEREENEDNHREIKRIDFEIMKTRAQYNNALKLAKKYKEDINGLNIRLNRLKENQIGLEQKYQEILAKRREEEEKALKSRTEGLKKLEEQFNLIEKFEYEPDRKLEDNLKEYNKLIENMKQTTQVLGISTGDYLNLLKDVEAKKELIKQAALRKNIKEETEDLNRLEAKRENILGKINEKVAKQSEYMQIDMKNLLFLIKKYEPMDFLDERTMKIFNEALSKLEKEPTGIEYITLLQDIMEDLSEEKFYNRIAANLNRLKIGIGTINEMMDSLKEIKGIEQDLGVKGTTYQDLISSYQALQKESIRAADGIKKLSQQLGTISLPQVEYKYFGGLIPKGRDIVPAMLSPGEFVVNARATKKYFSNLVAMNVGTKPKTFEKGGPVTNVGDINITLKSTGRESLDVRSIGMALRREIKRGVLTLD